ncbi:MAG: hypothetical protein ACHQK9_10570 [Reyranellales bacterium]
MNLASISSRLRLILASHDIDVGRVAFLATVVFAGATFWFVPRLPMTDLPQHAGQVALWHDMLLGKSKWQSLLYINYFTPYLAGAGFALPLSFLMPVSAALKLVLTVAYYGFVAASVALRRRLGGDPRLDWLFIPGFFGYAYAWGFYTFLVAVPIGMLFIVLAHRYAGRPTPILGAVLVLLDLVLFFSHGLVFLYANCIGGVFLLLGRRRLAPLLVAMLPYAAVGLWCVAYVLVRPRLAGDSLDDMLGTFGWDSSRLNFLVLSIAWPVGDVDADWRLGPLVLLMLAAPIALGARLNRRDSSAFAPLLVTVLLWVLVPFSGVWSLYQRFALFLLPFYAVIFRPPERVTRRVILWIWLPVVSWAFLAVHVERLFAFAKESAGFDEVLAVTEPGQRAFALIFDATSAAAGHDNPYLHLPLWYEAEKGGFVDFNFAVFPQEVVRYRPNRVPAAFKGPPWAWRPGRHFDRKWLEDASYRYFFVRNTAPLPPAFFPADCQPKLLKSAGSWSVFENVNCFQERK